MGAQGLQAQLQGSCSTASAATCKEESNFCTVAGLPASKCCSPEGHGQAPAVAAVGVGAGHLRSTQQAPGP